MSKTFPLEVYGGGPANRQEIEQEMWLAALQEPAATFKPFGDEWPATTLPAFEAGWAAFQQGETTGRDFDLRIRQAFFAEGRNIGQREVMLELAREARLDMSDFSHHFESGEAREAVLAEGRLGKDKYGVHETPTIMLGDGTLLKHPMVLPQTKDNRVVAVGRLPCCGDACYAATRDLFDMALNHEEVGKARRP